MLLIGKGNSAFETADHLTEKAAIIHIAGPSSIRFAWRTHFIGHLRAVNARFLDTYQLKTQNSVLDCTIKRIERRADGRYLVAVDYLRRDTTAEFVYDRVIACTGFRMDATIYAPECRPKLTIRDRFPELTHEWESVNVPDLYFAGTLTQSRDFKKYTSAFIHGFRYGIRALTHILEQKYEDVRWPSRDLPADPAVVADAALARLNRTSALWQFHFMSDVVLLDGSDDGGAHYYEEMPVDYVRASDLGKSRDCFTFTLEYGAGHDEIDPFDVAVGRAWEDAHKHDDRYLHPVVRHYRHGTLLDELRLKENLDNDWTDETEHRKPLREFIAGQLAADSPGPTRRRKRTRQSRQRSRHGSSTSATSRKRRGTPGSHPLRLLRQWSAGRGDGSRQRSGFQPAHARPRVLRGIGEPTLEVSLLGCDASAPILLAPTAFHRLAHPEAELATARAAAATGTIMIAAMLSTVAIEDLAAAARTIAAEPGLWFQLYIQPDLGFTEAIVRRAEAAGCRALVVTSDSPVLGRNERNDRNDFHDLPAGLRCENLRELRGGEPGSVRQVSLSPQISWSHLDWLRKTSDLPILVKGILHPEDAKLAVHRGVDALVVSNHGGRQLDTAPATIDQLPRIVEAVDGQVPVLLDGGIRRGTDVVKALALGADAVAVGRPALWGLAADGERGVVSVLSMLRNELAHTLTLCGAASPRDLRRDQVQERPC